MLSGSSWKSADYCRLIRWCVSETVTVSDNWFVFNVDSVYCTVFLCVSDRSCSLLHTCSVVYVSWLLKTVLLSLQAIPIFVGIRGSVTHFSELGVILPILERAKINPAAKSLNTLLVMYVAYFLYHVNQKLPLSIPFYFLNNPVKSRPSLIIFGSQLSEEACIRKLQIFPLHLLPVKCNCRNMRSSKSHFSTTLNSNTQLILQTFR